MYPREGLKYQNRMAQIESTAIKKYDKNKTTDMMDVR